jgi:predicted nucleotidyltransferase
VRSLDREQLDRVLVLARDVLGPDLVGAYLFGSAVLGGLQARSDLDLLIVSSRATTRGQKKRLVGGLLAVSGHKTSQGQWRHIELTIVVEADIRPWRYPPRFDFQYGDWLRDEFESGNIEPWPTTTNPDLASLITMVLLGNTPLLGPPPARIFDPVPHNDLIRAVVTDVDTLLDDLGWDTRNVILTLARIWSTVATGTVRSKDTAAGWAVVRLPQEHRAVLARARSIYLGHEEEHWDDLQSQVRPCADYVVGEIERSVASDSGEQPPTPAN